MQCIIQKVITIFALALLCSLSLHAQDKIKSEKVCISEQEYAVYEVVGVRNFQNETNGQIFFEHLETELPNISSEVVADYKEKNSKTYFLRCVLKSNQEKKNLKKSYSTVSRTSFSRIGFNRDETEALVHSYWESAGNYCGGEFVHLRKENNKWTVVKKVMTVIC